MTFTQEVAQKVEELGRADVDDLVPHFTSHTRDQVVSALHNASFRGYIVIVERGKSRGKGKGTFPSVFGPAAVPEKTTHAPEVFALANVWKSEAAAHSAAQL